VDSEYGRHYRDLFERHWWWRARERLILDTLRRHQPASGWRAVLDVGCGDGLFFDKLATLDGVTCVEGVEPEAALVSRGGPHADNIFVAPFDERFDPGRRYSLILMLDVLEHLPNPVGAVSHVLSLLEPKGVFLATVPAFMALWTRHDDLNHHFTRYTARSFRSVADAAGLKITAARYFFHWLAAAKIATRLSEKVVSGAPDVPRVPPAPINRTCYALSRLEERLLGAARIPFGSSLLVVGTRGA
jgi:2-polyprenyl-3-methyl-5-hydroxy-6-metoxy-1,4-benzoquinol methylase